MKKENYKFTNEIHRATMFYVNCNSSTAGDMILLKKLFPYGIKLFTLHLNSLLDITVYKLDVIIPLILLLYCYYYHVLYNTYIKKKKRRKMLLFSYNFDNTKIKISLNNRKLIHSHIGVYYRFI